MPPKSKRQQHTSSSNAATAAAAAAARDTKETAIPSIDWPLFQPLLPVQDLTLTHLATDQICTISRLWTPTLCKTYVSFLSSLPLVTAPGGLQPKRGHAVRVNDRLQVHDPAFASRLWHDTALKQLLLPTGSAEEEEESSQLSEQEQCKLWGGRVVGLNPNIRIYRYSKGQFFAQHYDDSNAVTLDVENRREESSLAATKPQRARTTWTLLLYLTSAATGCEGGETVFYPEDLSGGSSKKKGSSKTQTNVEPIVVELETGMALLHKHGKDCMLHEGREVKAGEKWVIRTDLCVAVP